MKRLQKFGHRNKELFILHYITNIDYKVCKKYYKRIKI